jgi:hypothetical protein
MKKLYKLFLAAGFIFIQLAINGCDPFDDAYLTLALETDFNTFAPVPNVNLTQRICLSDFDDYEDNNENIKEIKYISAAYITLEPSNGLQGDFILRFYREDTNTLLFEYSKIPFVAEDWINKPLEIMLNQQQISDINSYLVNPKVDKCFRVELEVANATDNDGAPFQLHGKVEILTELQIAP